jgi:hypothetical protein
LRMITGYQLARPRPTYADVRTGARIDLVAERNDKIHYGGWVEGMWDTFLKLPHVDAALPPVGHTLQFGPMIRLGSVDLVRLRPTGWSNELRPFMALAESRTYPFFAGAFLEWFRFWLIGDRWNIAWRSQAGISSDSEPEFHYFLGGLALIRGFPDNYIETQMFAMFNLEVRCIVFDSTWFAVQPAAFIDGAIARNETQQAVGALSVGAGIRFLIPRLVHSGLHADFAWPLVPLALPRNIGLPMLNIGAYEFF